MKAAAFDYVRAHSVAEACSLLSRHEDARVIAGGQTLVPMMAMRLARPPVIIDIGRIPELQTITEEADAIVIGAGLRQARAEFHPLVGAKIPLLARALPFVGHTPTRNRGTLGGSVANADPAAEIPLVLVTLCGTVGIQKQDLRLNVPAGDFIQGPMMTALDADAVITALEFPVWPEPAIGTGFFEVSARQSDFAYVSAAAQVSIGRDGRCGRCAIGIGGATPVPTRLDRVAQALIGSDLSDQAIRTAVEPAVAELEIMVDAHASPAYRRRVAASLAVRAIAAARDDARSRLNGARQ